jgi:hypothetical protein
MTALGTPPDRDTAPPVPDLLRTGGQLSVLLRDALDRRDWMDAFLCAAGLNQLVEDRLHPDPLLLQRAAAYLHGRPASVARIAAAAASAVDRRLTGTGARLVPARHALSDLTVRLARLVYGERGPQPRSPSPRLAGLAVDAVGDEIVRLPACFHSFDQHPDDVRWLVRQFARRSVRVPLCVLGVRTSGSYLAPLCAAALRAGGFPDVEVLTYRPGRPLLSWERQRLRAAARAGGAVLITGDPPGSGASVAAAAAEVMRAGIPERAVVLLLSLFADGADPPPVLRRWRCVLQPWPQWTVHGRLADAAVAVGLAHLLGPPWSVDAVRRVASPMSGGSREHVWARFRVRLTDQVSGRAEHRDIVVEGAGLGCLGQHAADVAGVLSEHLPRTYGVIDGLLYRDWLPAAERPVGNAEVIAAAVAYIAQRRQRLPVDRDPAPRLRGRDPAWEVGAALLARQYGRLAPLARRWPLEPAVRRLLAVDSPCLVDGNTDRRHFLRDPGRGDRLSKVDFHQRAYSHLDVRCYDPAFDLAGLAADPPHTWFATLVRDSYQRHTGSAVDPERWLLYRLVQLWRLERLGDIGAGAAGRQAAAAVHDFLAAHCLGDLVPAGSGPLCAIGLDGVLETDPLGYPAASPTGVLALRALIAHGYRPVLATGRSLDEARERCAVFGLAGAVAEYGAVIYDHADRTVTDLRDPGQQAVLDAARRHLGALPEVRIDPAHRYAVRARSGGGPLPDAVCARLPGGLVVIHGPGRTDITAPGTDQGVGLRALATRLGDPACALAVGDTAADLPLLALARLARAPRNADAAVRDSGVRVTRHAYQAGLADACADLLGHRPGRCPTCRPPRPAVSSRALLAVLALREDGLRQLPAGTARVALLSARRRQW